MSVIKLFKRRRRNVEWSYSTKGYLWRLVPSEDGLFVIEDRDVEGRKVTFACLDRRTGTMLWQGLELSEQWWITVDRIHNGILFLHEYASPDMPEQKKIYAIDLASGRLLWSNEEMKLAFIDNTSVYAGKDDILNRKFFELDLMTGAVKNEVPEESLDAVRGKAATNAVIVQFPTVFENSGEKEFIASSVVQAEKKARNVVLTEYLELGETAVIGYYEHSGPVTEQKFRQHIAVAESPSAGIVFEDVISSEAAVPVPDTFFAIDSMMYYIKDKKQLTALNLAPR